jgi:hypothetical protein
MTSLPIILDGDDYSEAFSRACDAIERALYGPYDPRDGVRHTSDEARSLTLEVFERVGIMHAPSDYPPPGDLPIDLWGLWNASAEVHHGDREAFETWRLRLDDDRDGRETEE